MMGDIGEEITEIELEPLPEDQPTEAPAELAAEPAAGRFHSLARASRGSAAATCRWRPVR